MFAFSQIFVMPSGKLTHPALFCSAFLLGFGLYFTLVKAGPPPSGSTCTFTQLVSTDWNTGNNWSCTTADGTTESRIPTIDDAVVIPKDKSVVINDPLAGGNAFSLSLDGNSTLNVQVGALTIAEATINKGSISAARDSVIYFGMNDPNSVTTNEIYEHIVPTSTGTTSLLIPSTLATGGGNIVFFNHFLNKGKLDASKNGSIAFQRDWTQTMGYAEYFFGADGKLLFFGGYEQSVQAKPFKANILTVEKDGDSFVKLAIGKPKEIKDYYDILYSDKLYLREIHLNSGKLFAGSSILSLEGQKSSPTGPLPAIWENAGGEFNGGTGVVVFDICNPEIRGSEMGFNDILINLKEALDPAITMPPGCTNPYVTLKGDIRTNVLRFGYGGIDLNANTLFIQGRMLPPLSEDAPVECGPGACFFYKPDNPGKVVFSVSNNTLFFAPSQLHDLSVQSTKPLIFSGPKSLIVLNNLTIGSGVTFHFGNIGGSSVLVRGSFENDGQISGYITTPLTFIHPTDYARFTNALGTPVLEYTAPANVYIEVKDTNRNLDGTVVETMNVQVTSESSGVDKDAETVVLTETAVNSGIFRGSISYMNAAPTKDNGKLEMDDFGSANLRYTDLYDPTDVATDFVPLNL